MLVLVVYDIDDTKSTAGRKRLTKVAEKCEAYGHRVQNSVFECLVNQSQYVILKKDLQMIIDNDVDSLIFYNIGNNYKTKIEYYGKETHINLEDTLLL